MKNKKLIPSPVVVLAVVLYLGGISALAQHGQGQGSGHATMGHGAPMSHGSKSESDNGSKAGSNNNMGGKKTVDEQLAHDSRLSSKLQGLLPANTNVQDTAKGFKNMGQFVAALHVSRNLNIPFDQLKAKMTGKPPMSLGKAIHELDPNVDPKAETKKAEQQAMKDIKDNRTETKEAQKHAE
jgi:hypothetical protein